jgi:hypothetical protein
MWIRSVLITLLALLLLAEPALADIVMLRDGDKFVGTVVGRDEVMADPSSFKTISLIPDGSEDIVRFASEDIEYILFQNDAGGLLVEFAEPTQAGQQETTMMATGSVGSKGGAAWMIAAGFALLGVGVFVKFGDEPNTSASGSRTSTEKSYNAMNYAWIGLGSALIAAGVLRHMAGSQAGYSPADNLMIGYRNNQGHDGLAVGYRLAF